MPDAEVGDVERRAAWVDLAEADASTAVGVRGPVALAELDLGGPGDVVGDGADRPGRFRGAGCLLRQSVRAGMMAQIADSGELRGLGCLTEQRRG